MGKTLYLECYSGISEDMAAAALLDLGAEQTVMKAALASLPVGGFRTEITRVRKLGVDVCNFQVILDEEHKNHAHDEENIHKYWEYKEINRIFTDSDMTERAMKTALHIFDVLAEAKAKVYGVPKEQTRFQETDSIVYIAAVAICLDNLDITEVIVPELYEGKGAVRCCQGMLPVPVPEVVHIVQQNRIPLKITEFEGELVTPAGAAVAAALRTSGQLPENFVIQKTGMGAGKKNHNCPGILRAMVLREKTKRQENLQGRDRIWHLETNIDDCTGEELGNVMKLLFEAGAKDVYYTPIYMKKNRPAYELSVICTEETRNILENIIFEETTTIGIRRTEMERTVLKREIHLLEAEGFPVKAKICTLPDGSRRCYPEHDSAAALAADRRISYREAWQKIRECWKKKGEAE
nr:nickel pincer cofactor biosynthesis protein LarC [uncultured Blautia sp.]